MRSGVPPEAQDTLGQGELDYSWGCLAWCGHRPRRPSRATARAVLPDTRCPARLPRSTARAPEQPGLPPGIAISLVMPAVEIGGGAVFLADRVGVGRSRKAATSAARTSGGKASDGDPHPESALSMIASGGGGQDALGKRFGLRQQRPPPVAEGERASARATCFPAGRMSRTASARCDPDGRAPCDRRRGRRDRVPPHRSAQIPNAPSRAPCLCAVRPFRIRHDPAEGGQPLAP